MKSDFYIDNRKRLMDPLSDESIVIVYSGNMMYKTGDETYPFTPNRNFFYLTGIDRDNMILVMIKSKQTCREKLFIENNDPVLSRWIGEKLSHEEAEKLSGITNIQSIDSFEKSLHYDIASLLQPKVWLDFQRRGWQEAVTWEQTLHISLSIKYPYITPRHIGPAIHALRRIKQPEEIKLIEKAIDLTHQGLTELVTHCQPGMMEYELEAYFDFILRKNGVTDKAFKTIAACGKNAATLHYCDNCAVSGESDLLLLDLGAQWEYYSADITRTIPVCGHFSNTQKTLYQIVLDTQQAVIDRIKPGLLFEELNKTARKELLKGLQTIGKCQNDSDLQEFYYHGVSHYLGLDTHDVGQRDVLEPGMVITVEPGLYFRDENIGIRIEDDVLITQKGYQILSCKIPKTVNDIEKWMKGS